MTEDAGQFTSQRLDFLLEVGCLPELFWREVCNVHIVRILEKREKKSSRRSIGQHCVISHQILPQLVDPGRVGLGFFVVWLLHHLVINEQLANVPDFDVVAVGLPELPCFQLR